MRKGVRGNNILRLEDERYKSDNTGKFDRSESLRKWLEKNSRSMNSEEKRVVGLLLGGESEKLEGLRKISSMEIRLPIDIVSAFLYDESEKIRLGALETLLALGKISDISRVIELASDPSERVREKACSLLGYGGKESVSVLIDALMDGNVKVRRAAACSLERCVHENMAQIDIKRIVANLDDCDDEVCEYISRSLKRIGKASVPALVSMVLSAEIPSQRKMLEVLSSFEDTRCREIFRMFVSDSDRIAREHAANGLLKIAENRDIEALVEVFSSDRKKIDTFVDMLLKLPGKGIKELESCLNSVNPNSRAFAIMCLSRLGEYRHGEVDTEICDKIAKKIYDDSIDVRIEVIRAFQRFGISKRYVGMLIRGIEDNEWKVRAETLTCILENRISSMYEYVERCLFDNRPEVRGLAVETINRLGINEAIPKLIDLMLDVTEDYKIVERVACMLSCCKDERVAKPFVELLVRGHFTDLCITGLKNIGKKSKDVILENLSRIEENRAGVLALLCKFGVKNCKEELLGMVGKDLEGVFRAVLKYGDKRLIEEVTEKISRDELDKCVDDLDNELYACLLSNSNDEIFLHALDNLRYINSIEAVRILLLCKYKKERKKKFEKELGYHLSKLLNDNLSDLKKSKHAKDIRKRARIVLDTIDL